MQIQKFKHFYFNKYLLPPFRRQRYFLSIDYQHKLLWFRVAKVGTRSIHALFTEACRPEQYIYGSATPYLPGQFDDFFKFAFVRDPIDRFQSAWRDKVQRRNYFNFSEADHSKMQQIEHFVEWTAQLDITRCDRHLRAQTALIDLPHLDFLGRFERFGEDMQIIAEKLGQTPQAVPHKNQTQKKKDSGLAPDVRQKIADIYRHDYDLLYS